MRAMAEYSGGSMDTLFNANRMAGEDAGLGDRANMNGNGSTKPARRRSKPASWLPVLAVFLLLEACNGLAYDPALFSDDQWISREGDTYSYVQRSMQHSGEGQIRDLGMSFSGFHGKHSVWMVDAAAETMLTAETCITTGLRGQYKVCLVDPDRQVRILADRVGTQQHEIQLEPGRYYVVLVGMDASGTLAMSLAITAGADSVSIKDID
jgi:hypothetical protein